MGAVAEVVGDRCEPVQGVVAESRGNARTGRSRVSAGLAVIDRLGHPGRVHDEPPRFAPSYRLVVTLPKRGNVDDIARRIKHVCGALAVGVVARRLPRPARAIVVGEEVVTLFSSTVYFCRPISS